jgi:CBS domain-containing protein
MVTCPAVHGASATVRDLRTFFRDDHVHAALLVDAGVLIGVVERRDLGTELSADMPARTFAKLDGRTVHADAGVRDTLDAMKRAKRRRVAVVGDDGRLLGLLCLKANGRGFCCDADVSDRRSATERPA